MTTGERGPTGDHGQDGRQGVSGVPGKMGATGPIGKTGIAGKDVLSKSQTIVAFCFIVFCYVILAYRAETNANHIRDGVERQNKFLMEICHNQPALAPQTCALPR